LGGLDYEDRKKRHRERDRKSKRVEVIQRDIEKIEKAMAALDDRLVEVATNYAQVAALSAERDVLEARHLALFDEWETLDQELRMDG